MAKKIDYAKMFTLRSDGRYQGYWHEMDKDGQPKGERHAIYDKDPERLYNKILGKENPPEKSFGKILTEWEADHKQRVGYKAAEAYSPCVRRITEKYGDGAIGGISAADIQAYLVYLGKRGYARRTVQMHRDVLNMAFNFAIVHGYTDTNPCAAVSMPRGLPTTKRELPSDDAIAAVKERTDAPFALVALICLYAGLRRGEVLALRYEDIDRAVGVIHVTKAVEFIGNQPQIKPPKSNAGERDVILLDQLAAHIPQKGKGYIFCREDGGLLTKMQYRKRWLQYCKEIGYDITAHQLRHGYATILYEAGIADKDAQELLGHSSISVTRNVYTHIRQTRKKATANRLNDYIKRQQLMAQLTGLLSKLLSKTSQAA